MPNPNDVETVERVIPAPAEKIFALIADPSRHPEIDGSGTVRKAKDGAQCLTLGSKFGMSMKMGLPYSMIGARLGGGRIWRYELEPVANGTRVRESWDISEEKVKAIVRPARKKTRKAMEQTLARIEALLTE